MDPADQYMRLALKAQSQCRAAIEALAEIKNPKPVAFVQQANIANGPQQVNNSRLASLEPSRAGKTGNQQSKLLEQNNGERLDIGTASQVFSSDPAMATMGEIHGTKVERG
jgi:hypothetical protein